MMMLAHTTHNISLAVRADNTKHTPHNTFAPARRRRAVRTSSTRSAQTAPAAAAAHEHAHAHINATRTLGVHVRAHTPSMRSACGRARWQKVPPLARRAGLLRAPQRIYIHIIPIMFWRICGRTQSARARVHLAIYIRTRIMCVCLCVCDVLLCTTRTVLCLALCSSARARRRPLCTRVSERAHVDRSNLDNDDQDDDDAKKKKGAAVVANASMEHCAAYVPYVHTQHTDTFEARTKWRVLSLSVRRRRRRRRAGARIRVRWN